MNCLKVEEQFSAYIEDELGYQGIKALEGHLAGCARCRREFLLFRESLDLTRRLPKIEASPEFDISLQIRLADAQIEPAPLSVRIMDFFQFRSAWALAGIAALFVMFAGVYTYQNALIKPSPVVARTNSPSIHVRPAPQTEISRRGLWQSEFPLAGPQLIPQPSLTISRSPEVERFSGPQEPQRIERNYILQTVNYTDAPTGGGL